MTLQQLILIVICFIFNGTSFATNSEQTIKLTMKPHEGVSISDIYLARSKVVTAIKELKQAGLAEKLNKIKVVLFESKPPQHFKNKATESNQYGHNSAYYIYLSKEATVEEIKSAILNLETPIKKEFLSRDKKIDVLFNSGVSLEEIKTMSERIEFLFKEIESFDSSYKSFRFHVKSELASSHEKIECKILFSTQVHCYINITTPREEIERSLLPHFYVSDNVQINKN